MHSSAHTVHIYLPVHTLYAHAGCSRTRLQLLRITLQPHTVLVYHTAGLVRAPRVTVTFLPPHITVTHTRVLHYVCGCAVNVAGSLPRSSRLHGCGYPAHCHARFAPVLYRLPHYRVLRLSSPFWLVLFLLITVLRIAGYLPVAVTVGCTLPHTRSPLHFTVVLPHYRSRLPGCRFVYVAAHTVPFSSRLCSYLHICHVCGWLFTFMPCGSCHTRILPHRIATRGSSVLLHTPHCPPVHTTLPFVLDYPVGYTRGCRYTYMRSPPVLHTCGCRYGSTTLRTVTCRILHTYLPYLPVLVLGSFRFVAFALPVVTHRTLRLPALVTTHWLRGYVLVALPLPFVVRLVVAGPRYTFTVPAGLHTATALVTVTTFLHAPRLHTLVRYRSSGSVTTVGYAHWLRAFLLRLRSHVADYAFLVGLPHLPLPPRCCRGSRSCRLVLPHCGYIHFTRFAFSRRGYLRTHHTAALRLRVTVTRLPLPTTRFALLRSYYATHAATFCRHALHPTTCGYRAHYTHTCTFLRGSYGYVTVIGFCTRAYHFTGCAPRSPHAFGSLAHTFTRFWITAYVGLPPHGLHTRRARRTLIAYLRCAIHSPDSQRTYRLRRTRLPVTAHTRLPHSLHSSSPLVACSVFPFWLPLHTRLLPVLHRSACVTYGLRLPVPGSCRVCAHHSLLYLLHGSRFGHLVAVPRLPHAHYSLPYAQLRFTPHARSAAVCYGSLCAPPHGYHTTVHHTRRAHHALPATAFTTGLLRVLAGLPYWLRLRHTFLVWLLPLRIPRTPATLPALPVTWITLPTRLRYRSLRLHAISHHWFAVCVTFRFTCLPAFTGSSLRGLPPHFATHLRFCVLVRTCGSFTPPGYSALRLLRPLVLYPWFTYRSGWLRPFTFLRLRHTRCIGGLHTLPHTHTAVACRLWTLHTQFTVDYVLRFPGFWLVTTPALRLHTFYGYRTHLAARTAFYTFTLVLRVLPVLRVYHHTYSVTLQFAHFRATRTHAELPCTPRRLRTPRVAVFAPARTHCLPCRCLFGSAYRYAVLVLFACTLAGLVRHALLPPTYRTTTRCYRYRLPPAVYLPPYRAGLHYRIHCLAVTPAYAPFRFAHVLVRAFGWFAALPVYIPRGCAGSTAWMYALRAVCTHIYGCYRTFSHRCLHCHCTARGSRFVRY